MFKKLTVLAGIIGLLLTSQCSKLSISSVAVTPPTRPTVNRGSNDGVVLTPELGVTDTFLATNTAWKQIVGITAEYLATSIGTPEPGPTGILDGPDAGFPPSMYSLANRWYGELNGHQVAVFAGALADTPDQGLVHVIEWNDPRVETQHLTPIRVGSVHIIAERNLRLTLLSTNGTTLYFDVPGQQFVDSLAQIVPTVTPFKR